MRRKAKLGFWVTALLATVMATLVACTSDSNDEAVADLQSQLAAKEAELTAAQETLQAPPQVLVQVGTPAAGAPASAPITGWDTEYSVEMSVYLLESFDSSGPLLWDAADHPLVYFASEGPGYGGLTSSEVALPGYQAIDAKTHEVLVAQHYNIGDQATEDMEFHDVQGLFFEPHGLGVSPDGQFVYIPTASGTSFSGAQDTGRLIVVNAQTGLIHQVLQVPGRPHHIKSFVDSQGNDRVLVYSWNFGAYILDPSDDNRVVGAVPNSMLMGRGYLAFVDPSGKYLWYTVRPPGGVESEGSVAIIDTETWSYVRNIGIEDPSPIFVAFSGDGNTTYVTGGHESIVAKIDTSSEDPSDWDMVKFARAGTEGPYGLNLNWTEDQIITIGKGEGSHNKGITVGLVDPTMVGRARPSGEVYTGCLRADHGLLNPDPDANELWISCNSSFETIILDLSMKDDVLGDWVKARIPSPNGGSTHNGAFVQYNSDWTGRVVSDQNGLHGTALEAKLQLLATMAAAR